MSGRIRAQTVKHVIILTFSILIALAVSLHLSKKAFAADALPTAFAEDGEAEEDVRQEDAQHEEISSETATAGKAEGPEAAEFVSDPAAQTDAEHVNAESEEGSGGSADGTSAEVCTESEPKVSGSASAADAPANTESGAEVSDGAEETGAGGSKDEAETAGEAPAAADSEENAAETETEAGTAEAESGEEAVDAAGRADDSSDPEQAGKADAPGGSGQADGTAGTADAVNASEAEAAEKEEGDSGSEAEGSMVRAGETVDPLAYLLECLKYHGNEEQPSAFSLRAYTEDGQSIVTSVKDQTPWQTCWGFSAIAASESSILAECYARWDQLAQGFLEKYNIKSFQELCEWLDLSERQIAWSAFTPEPENGNYPSQAGEGLIAREYGMGGIYNALGESYYATSVFARGTGPLEESRVPYQNNEGVLSSGTTVTAKDGKEYLDQYYLDYMIETRNVEYECLIPLGMTKEDVIEYFSSDPVTQEKVRQRLEEGVTTKVSNVFKFVDDAGKYYSVIRMNLLDEVREGYPDILIFEDEDGIRYQFDPETMSFPGLPLIRRAYYDWSVDDSLRYASVVQLKSSNILPKYVVDGSVDEAAIKSIKEELVKGHGVSMAFCADTSSPGSEDPAKYINSADNIWAHYTYLDTAGANHGVTIVGYNDSFPKTLFLEGHEPERDGAWLVKNSWGGGLSTGTDFGNWGIDENGDGIGDGYFWLSYWDRSIMAVETFEYRVEDFVTDRMEFDIRQHDLMTTSESIKINCEKAANVFETYVAENVREIGVQNSEDDTTISYEIYLLKEGAANPEDGVLLASGSEYFRYAGYHRIRTDRACIIPAGCKYSVIVKQMREGRPYVTVFYDYNEQSVKDREASGVTGIKKYSNAVVNKGESYLSNQGQWADWAELLPTFTQNCAAVNPNIKAEWMCVDNFTIKAYADFIGQDLSAEATKIGSTEAAATVGVSEKEAAEKDALITLAMVHNEISNGAEAAKAASVEEGYISAEEYSAVVNALVDPDRATGLKVVVVTEEIPASAIDEQGLNKLLEAADQKIARYADISLIILASDTGEYLGSLHGTEDPIDLAIAIPSDLLAAGSTVYVLRLHDGNVERLETTVGDGLAYFVSDRFSRFALAYEVNEPAEEPGPDPSDDKTNVVPADPDTGNVKPVKKTAEKKEAGTGIKSSAGRARVIPAETGDVSDTALWLLMMLASGAVLASAFLKKERRM